MKTAMPTTTKMMAMKLVCKSAIPTTVTTKTRVRQHQDASNVLKSESGFNYCIETWAGKREQSKQGLMHIVKDYSLSEKLSGRWTAGTERDWGRKYRANDGSRRLETTIKLWKVRQSALPQLFAVHFYLCCERRLQGHNTFVDQVKWAPRSHAMPDWHRNETFREMNEKGTNDGRDDATLQPISPDVLHGFALRHQVYPGFHDAETPLQ